MVFGNGGIGDVFIGVDLVGVVVDEDKVVVFGYVGVDISDDIC